MTNGNLHNAKRNKNDEFFTRYEDIEKEVVNYKEQLKGKSIYCNCDDYRFSNFVKLFVDHFKEYGLKKLITTSFNANGHGTMLVYEGDKNGNRVADDEEITITELKGNGDFRSEECIELLKQADIVVTNPPFSLFREYVAQLMEYGKKFLVIGNYNAVTFKEIFPLIKENKLWLGISPRSMEFVRPNGDVDVVNSCWFTNLEHKKRHQPMDFYKKYAGHEDEYPKYDNYDAIECGKTCEIPEDYDGVIGVPITFLDKYCPEQFEIVSSSDFAINDIEGWKGVSQEFYDLYYAQGNKGQIQVGWALPHYIENGKAKIPYKRILIRFKR